MPAKPISLKWPLGGLFKRLANSKFPAGSFTPDCENVVPDDVFEGRERGGSRPGFSKYYATPFGATIRGLCYVTYNSGGTMISRLCVVANGTLYAETSLGVWAAVTGGGGTWYWNLTFQGALANTNVAEMVPSGSPHCTVSTTTGGGGGNNEVQKIAVDLTYRPTADLFDWPGTRWRCINSTYLPLDASATEVLAEAETTYGDGNVTVAKVYGGTLNINSTVPIQMAERGQMLYIADHAAEPLFEGDDGIMPTTSTFTSVIGGAFTGVGAYNYSLEVTAGGSANSATQTFTCSGTPTGGTFKIRANIDGEYFETDPIAYNCSSATMQAAIRKAFVDSDGVVIGTFTCTGSAFPGNVITLALGGNLGNRRMDQFDTDASGLTGGTAVEITVAVTEPGGPPRPGTYMITDITGSTITFAPANTNDSGSAGGLSYRIVRTPKQYDPVENVLTPWRAEIGKGTIPANCPLCCKWRDRLVLAGAPDEPHVYAMSRQGNPYDWDYSVPNDAGAAIFGQASLAGQIGEPITCLIPHSNDCLIVGCKTSLWILRGDPGSGGTLDRLSDVIGVVGPNAWCYTPEEFLYFMSQDGVYQMAPGCGSVPRSVSREVLPQEFLLVATREGIVSMAYNVQLRMILVAVSFEDSSAYDEVHYWLDVKHTQNQDTGASAAFWPITCNSDIDPFCLITRKTLDGYAYQNILIGSRDGYLRHDIPDVAYDGANTFATKIWLGPYLVDDISDSMIHELICSLAADSGPVVWEVKVGKSAEQCLDATPIAAGTFWNAGFNPSARPRIRGGAIMVKLSGRYLGQRWALESLTAMIERLGRRRM